MHVYVCIYVRVCVYTSTDVFTLSYLNYQKILSRQIHNYLTVSQNLIMPLPAFCISAVTILIFPEANGYFCLMSRDGTHTEKGAMRLVQ